MDRIFETDVLGKRQRVEFTLQGKPIDRVVLLEQLSYNPGVIADWTGKTIQGFDYGLHDICEVIRKTLDVVMPPRAPLGRERVTTPDGFVRQHDNWTSWRVSRPFDDEHEAMEWLQGKTAVVRSTSLDADKAQQQYRDCMLDLQGKIGDTVILNLSRTGFCDVFDSMGLELFTFFQLAYPGVLKEHLDTTTDREVQRVHAVADPALSPVILIAEDFATRQGPIFRPEFLAEFHYPYVRRLCTAWHEHDIKVIYHSDGNYREAIPNLIACGADGFYCLEKNCGMDIVELKNTWPKLVWAGGVDGVDLMERGTPEQVRSEVIRHITETHALETGGMFVASSSEINPPIPPENFRAMVEAVGSLQRRPPIVQTTQAGSLPGSAHNRSP